MIVTRRKLLTGVALGGIALAVANCSTDQIASFEAQWATVAGQIQQVVSSAAAYIPTIESIAATAASLFGPQYIALVQIGSAAFNQIVQTLINVVNNLSPPASSRLAARLRGSSPSMPIAIGVTPSGITVAGWKA